MVQLIAVGGLSVIFASVSDAFSLKSNFVCNSCCDIEGELRGTVQDRLQGPCPPGSFCPVALHQVPEIIVEPWAVRDNMSGIM